ncbi:YihY/virulence factor BrkB family protein [Acidobacteria bacterium AB60]|nr:YihY/virulence factor BrkB family protein [Acidobacteria bacterium AB60]
MSADSSIVDPRLNECERHVWEVVSSAPVPNLWRVEGLSARTIVKRVWNASLQDRIFGHAAELAFYFLFSLFPTLICASSILGLAARSAHQIYDQLLGYLALVLPTSALSTVVSVFNQTTAASTSGKVTFGLIAAIWSASVGVSACQGTLNAVYKVVDRRSYLKARIYAIGLTIVLIVTISLCLASMFASNFGVVWVRAHLHEAYLRDPAVVLISLVGWTIATAFLALSFAVVYYWAPDVRRRRWRWLSPGSAIGLGGWLLSSVGFRVYLHFFNSYTVTYGSLGAVIILLMWFYITGLMLLVGAEINSEIEAAAVESLSPPAPAATTFSNPVAPAA